MGRLFMRRCHFAAHSPDPPYTLKSQCETITLLFCIVSISLYNLTMEDLRNIDDENILSEIVRDSDYLRDRIGLGTMDFFKYLNDNYLYTDVQFKQLIDDVIFEKMN